MEKNDSRTLEELLTDIKDFQQTMELLDAKEKEQVKLFALGLMAASTATKRGMAV